MNQEEFTMEGEFSRSLVAQVFEDIATGLRDGNLLLEKDARKLTLSPSSDVRLSVEAGSSSAEETILLRMAWPRNGKK